MPATHRLVVREYIWTWQRLQGARRALFSEEDGDPSGRVIFVDVPEAVLPILRLKAVPFETISDGTRAETSGS